MLMCDLVEVCFCSSGGWFGCTSLTVGTCRRQSYVLVLESMGRARSNAGSVSGHVFGPPDAENAREILGMYSMPLLVFVRQVFPQHSQRTGAARLFKPVRTSEIHSKHSK